MSAAPEPELTPRRVVSFLVMVFGMFMAILDIQIVSASRPGSPPAPTRSAGCRPPT